MVRIIILLYIIIIIYYNIIILWGHRRICGPSLTATSLCGACLYRRLHRYKRHTGTVECRRNLRQWIPFPESAERVAKLLIRIFVTLCVLTLCPPELDVNISAHPLCKKWISYERKKKTTLQNTLHFVDKENGDFAACLRNFRRDLNIVFFLFGDSPAFGFYMPTFRNALFHLYRRCKQE